MANRNGKLSWVAYGTSQAFYYKKAEKENTKNGIKYESVMAELTPPEDGGVG